MLSSLSRSGLVGGWMAVLVLIVVSIATGADVSTTALLFALGAAPSIVALLIGSGASSPSVAQILYSAQTKDDRRR